MLVINFNGKKPAQRNYEYAVVGNSHSDIVRFALQNKLGEYDVETLFNDFDGYIKLQSAGKEYLDKVFIDNYSFENGCLRLDLHLTKKMTHWRNLAVQVQFESDNGNIVAQSEIVGLTLNGTIDADEPISEEYPEAIQQLESKVIGFDKRIKDCEEKVESADEILIDNPDDYLDENGLDKIIRPMFDNGNVNKSYMIDKKFIPSTLAKCEQHREENGYDYDGYADTFIEDLGESSFYKLFGSSAYLSDLYECYSLYYNQNGEITKGFRFGSENDGGGYEYGICNISGIEPNKVIRIIVGKYFEYDERGNKVFDEHSAIYSNDFADGHEQDIPREITEEQQVIELKADKFGSIYFDGDGNDLGFSNTRFILYGIEGGEQERIDYKIKELCYLDTTKKKRPLFVKKINGDYLFFENECRLAINYNCKKFSKTNLGNWFNTSKGNAIISGTINGKLKTYLDILSYLFGDNNYYGFGKWKNWNENHKDPYNPPFKLGQENKMIYCFQNYSSILSYITSNGNEKILRILNKKRRYQEIRSHNLYTIFSVVNLRFIRNFEWKFDEDTRKGWNGEMNDWELQLLLINKKVDKDDLLFIVPTWKQI